MKRFFLCLLIAGITVAFLPIGIPSAHASNVNLTFSIFFPPTHAHAKAAMDFAKAVEKQSNGKVKITCFPGSTLVKPNQAYSGVVKGIADMALSVFAYTRGRFPVMSAVDLPMGYPSGMVASRVAAEFGRIVNPKELQDVKVIYLHAHGPAMLQTKKPVRNLEDLKGMKIRAPGAVTEVLEVLGAIPVPMPMSESYEALQKGVVEGILSPVEVQKGWKLAEVTGNITNSQCIGYTNVEYVVMNLKKWKSLPEDVKKIFENLGPKWTDKHGKVWDSIDEEGIAYAKAQGSSFIELPEEEKAKWKKAVQPIIDKYIADTPNGAEYVQKIKELMKKFSD